MYATQDQESVHVYSRLCFLFLLLLTSMLVAQGIVEEEGEEEGATREANQRRRPRRVVQITQGKRRGRAKRSVVRSRSGQVMSGGGLARKFNFCFYLVYVTRHFFFLVPSIAHTHTHTVRTYNTATVKVDR